MTNALLYRRRIMGIGSPFWRVTTIIDIQYRHSRDTGIMRWCTPTILVNAVTSATIICPVDESDRNIKTISDEINPWTSRARRGTRKRASSDRRSFLKRFFWLRTKKALEDGERLSIANNTDKIIMVAGFKQLARLRSKVHRGNGG